MPPTAFSWLHLTDFHYGLKGQKSLWPNLRQPFLDDLAVLHERSGPWQALLFTGDLAQQGKSEEFREFQAEVLGRLWEKLKELGSGEAKLLAVPGNHDLFRPNPYEDNAAIDALLDKDGFQRIADKFWDKPTGAYRRVINDAFAAYLEWWKDEPHRPKDLTNGLLPGDFAYTLEHEGLKIGIVGLNTAFLQLQGGDYSGKLVWDVRQLDHVCGGAVDDWQQRHDFCLLLTHHGMDWLTTDAQKHGDSEIAPAGRFALHLFGHQHETGIASIRRGGNPNASRLFQGCSVFGMELFGEPPKLHRSHGYAAGKIQIDGQGLASLRFWPRIATNKTGPWRFIPDHENAHLLDDQGTVPESLPYKSRSPDAACGVRENGATNDPRYASSTRATSDAPRSTLPPRRPFFGRATELDTIANYLRPDHVGWGVVLDGPGGIGKTALALEAAYRAPAEHYPLKVFVTAKSRRLDPDGPRHLHDNRFEDFHALLTAIGLGLGRDDIQKTPQDKQPEFIRLALASQRALLVLDNLESLSKEERRRVYDLLEFLPPACKAIVTSRRRDETAARTLRLDRLDFPASQKLLADLGELWPPVAKLTEAEQQRLYAETGGNPLLLTWTAGQLGRAESRCRTVEQAVARLHEAHARHAQNEANDPLEFIFGDLLDTFTPDETAVLAALAHFTEPARLDWLLPLSDLSLTAGLTALDDLHNRALLLENEANETWLLPPLAIHFLRLQLKDEIDVAGQRLVSKIYNLVKQYGNNTEFIELENIWPTIQAALSLLIAGNNSQLQSLCTALEPFLSFTGRWTELLLLNQQAEKKARTVGDNYNAGWRALHAGMAHYRKDEADAVLSCAKRCRNYWRQSKVSTKEHAIAIRLIGLGLTTKNDFLGAITAFEESLILLRPFSLDKAYLILCLINDLAEAKMASGDQKGANAHFFEAANIRAMLDLQYEVKQKGLAYDYRCISKTSDGLPLRSAVLRPTRKRGDRECIVFITSNLAALALDRQDWPTAQRLATEALAQAEGTGHLELIAFNHHSLAQALRQQQRAKEALPHAQQSVAIFTRLRHPELTKAEATLAACARMP